MADTTQTEEAVPQSTDTTAERLQRVEELLEKQTEMNRKLLRSSRWRTVFMLIFVAAFVFVGISFYNVLTTITKDIPEVVTQAHNLMGQADELVGTANTAVRSIVNKVDTLDIDALNESIEGISSIDYAGLNTSIGGLARSVENFETFVDALSHPAQSIGGLFGGGRATSTPRPSSSRN